MNRAAVLAAACRAQAAYILDDADARAAFEGLGLTFIARYENDSHQAVVSVDGERAYLSISGTRFGHDLGDLLDDLHVGAHDFGGGAQAPAGVVEGLDEVYAWAASLMPPGTTWHIEGHSLGGERALMSGMFLPAAQIAAVHAFEAPKCGNPALWLQLAPVLERTVCVVNGADLWFGWPQAAAWLHPLILHQWLKDNAGHAEQIMPTAWPGGTAPGDHDISLVVNRLRAWSELAA